MNLVYYGFIFDRCKDGKDGEVLRTGPHKTHEEAFAAASKLRGWDINTHKRSMCTEG